MVTAVVGANWGDEGKGKITDMLAEKADIIKANSAFMALPVSQGEHEVELVYFTPYLKTGLICSLISVIGFGIYEFCNKKKKEA